jgi:hypothetical protein
VPLPKGGGLCRNLLSVSVGAGIVESLHELDYGIGDRGIGVRLPAEARGILISSGFRLALEPTKPRIKLLPWALPLVEGVIDLDMNF